MRETQSVVTLRVGNSSEMNYAIAQANAQTKDDSTTIIVQQNITLSANITPINTPGSLIIQSNGQSGTMTIDGKGQYQGFIVLNGTCTLQNLNLTNMSAKGASGCMGAGGGIFVANTSGYPKATTSYLPTITLTNVSFSNSKAQGGDAADGGSGGKGGAGATNPILDEAGGDGGAGGNAADVIIPKTATDVFGSPIISTNMGYFGTVNSGAGGNAGVGGQTHGVSNGSNGSTPDTPASSGYGAGSSAGGGGGGGGGGASASINGKGGNGANGSAGGDAGFGGGKGKGPDQGHGGSDAGLFSGGDGGKGGMGARCGSGAGFGGALFAMHNASITFTGSGTMSGNRAIGGAFSASDGSSGGAGIFLQGSGQLNFNLSAGDTYTIADEIIDETGLVNHSRATNVAGVLGPDNLPTGGGTGKWTIYKTGSGKLNIPNSLLAGDVIVADGQLVLPRHVNNQQNFTLGGNASLHQLRTENYLPGFKINNLVIEESATLYLNGYSNIIAENLICTTGTLNIVLDPAGFTPGKAIKVINIIAGIDKQLKVNVSDGYACEIYDNSIIITMNS